MKSTFRKGIARVRKFRKDEEGLASTIGTMMAILVFLTLFSMILSQWMPVWIKDKEAEHMREVEQDFADLRSKMDMQLLVGNKYLSVYTPVELGTGGIPIFSSGSRGSLFLDTTGFRLVLSNSTIRLKEARGGIYYKAYNQQYLSLNYILENGALMVEHSDQSINVIDPHITFLNTTAGVTVTITLFNIMGTSTTMTGQGTAGIYTKLIYNETMHWVNTSTSRSEEKIFFSIETKYPTAWELFLNRSINTPAENNIRYTQGYNLTRTAKGVDFDVSYVNELILNYGIIEVVVK
ncbi:MAG: hypothetical protein QW728_00975 [Thermoplasmata archaeon]